MKKIVAAFSILLCLLLCSCTKDTSGYICELTESSWSANLYGGAEVSLSFKGDNARLDIKNGENTASIKGKYVADNETFVIFVPEIMKNYSFDYITKGKTLEISYGSSKIRMKKST